MDNSLSVIIPCLNEELNLEDAYGNVMAALRETVETWEILIYDDGSTDRTGEIADRIAASDPRVRVFHNPQNMGFGYNFYAGVKEAKMTYVSVMPGDNEISQESIKRIFSLMGKADIIIPFTVNSELRPWSRRLVSSLYTTLLNALFCCELQYYNGPALHRVELVRALQGETSGFGFQSAMLVQLIRRGHSFCEVDMYLQPKRVYHSSAVRLKNILSVLGTVWRVWLQVRRDPALRETRLPNRINPHAA